MVPWISFATKIISICRYFLFLIACSDIFLCETELWIEFDICLTSVSDSLSTGTNQSSLHFALSVNWSFPCSMVPSILTHFLSTFESNLAQSQPSDITRSQLGRVEQTLDVPSPLFRCVVHPPHHPVRSCSKECVAVFHPIHCVNNFGQIFSLAHQHTNAS